jgi:hypothetical protein
MGNNTITFLALKALSPDNAHLSSHILALPRFYLYVVKKCYNLQKKVLHMKALFQFMCMMHLMYWSTIYAGNSKLIRQQSDNCGFSELFLCPSPPRRAHSDISKVVPRDPYEKLLRSYDDSSEEDQKTTYDLRASCDEHQSQKKQSRYSFTDEGSNTTSDEDAPPKHITFPMHAKKAFERLKKLNCMIHAREIAVKEIVARGKQLAGYGFPPSCTTSRNPSQNPSRAPSPILLLPLPPLSQEIPKSTNPSGQPSPIASQKARNLILPSQQQELRRLSGPQIPPKECPITNRHVRSNSNPA